MLVNWAELFFWRPTHWALPVIWQFLEGCPGFNTVLRVSLCWVIDVSTYSTFITLGHASAFDLALYKTHFCRE